ncbi:MAG TPA: hypothetical protein VK171_01035, partial [Fimbriimonas sp.]|nr:hypothetical protein [Fimbriimonas sp.]
MSFSSQYQEWIGEPFEPNEFEGIVMAGDKEHIASRLAAQVLQNPNFSLWKWQAFEHHDHPAFDLDDLDQELLVVAHWREVLSSRFPNFEFVIEQQPLGQVTWYQKLETAPCEDEPLWELAVRGTVVTFESLAAAYRGLDSERGDELRDLLSHSLSIELRDHDISTGIAQLSDFERPQIHPNHRGLMTVRHIESGTDVVFAKRTIRTVVGALD